MKKILIADDDRDIVELLESRLKNNNFDVVTAYDCSDAIKKAYSESPDLILMDIKMPKVGGLSAFDSLQMYSRTESIPVIFITAYPSKEIQQKANEMGATGFVSKPFDTDELISKINKSLEDDDAT